MARKIPVPMVVFGGSNSKVTFIRLRDGAILFNNLTNMVVARQIRVYFEEVKAEGKLNTS